MTDILSDFVKRAAAAGVKVSVRRLPDDLHGLASGACERGYHAQLIDPVTGALSGECRFCKIRC